MARAGVLYEGQRLVTPPLPNVGPSLANAHRDALPLGHTPVRIRLEEGGPHFRYYNFGSSGVIGFVGELIFHRHGPLQLADLTISWLLGYRLGQIAWAKQLFVERVCTEMLSRSGVGFLSATWDATANQINGPGYTITGRISASGWGTSNVSGGMKISLAMNPSTPFDSATLLLGEVPAPWGAPQERLIPLGTVLRAACPYLISPATLWVLTRDDNLFVVPQPANSIVAHETGRTPLLISERSTSARKHERKKQGVEKRATIRSRRRKSRKK
jgi:hypothetical protein